MMASDVDMCVKGSWPRAIVNSLPAWFRFAQCLRRYKDSQQVFPHLVNAGKYSTTLFVILFSFLNVYFTIHFSTTDVSSTLERVSKRRVIKMQNHSPMRFHPNFILTFLQFSIMKFPHLLPVYTSNPIQPICHIHFKIDLLFSRRLLNWAFFCKVNNHQFFYEASLIYCLFYSKFCFF